MAMNWYDRLHYKNLIEKALTPDVEVGGAPSWTMEVLTIRWVNKIMVPLFELFQLDPGVDLHETDKHVFYGFLTRWGQETGLLSVEEYEKIRHWLANFELA